MLSIGTAIDHHHVLEKGYNGRCSTSHDVIHARHHIQVGCDNRHLERDG